MIKRRLLATLRDYVLYVAVAVALLVLLWLWVNYRVKMHQVPRLPVNWFGFAGMTALVFGDAIRLGRPHWRQLRFWVLLAVFFAVQFGLALAVFSVVDVVPTLFWGFLIPLDYLVLGAYLATFLQPRYRANGPLRRRGSVG